MEQDELAKKELFGNSELFVGKWIHRDFPEFSVIIEKNGDIVKRIPMIAKERVRKIRLFGRVLKNISVMIWGK